MRLLVPLLLILLGAPLAAQQPSAADYRADAQSIERLIADSYAYRDRWPGGAAPTSERLRREAGQVDDRRSLLRYAERALLALADHHAITGASFPDSWSVVPSFSDLWIERRGGDFAITSVRPGSPADRAGIRAGDALHAVGDTPAAEAVAGFWRELGLEPEGERAEFAGRVLAAGRRNALRRLTIRRGAVLIPLELPSLYAAAPADRPPLGVARDGRALRIRFNDSLGDSAAIAAFDAAMAGARPGQPVILDLTDTPSGGNTVVAAPSSAGSSTARVSIRSTPCPRKSGGPASPGNGRSRSSPAPASVIGARSPSRSAAGQEAWARGWRSASTRSAPASSVPAWPACSAPFTTIGSNIRAWSSSCRPSG